jgi:photosystem II stability/assembly factor-like uncharacterized protein
MAAVIASNFNAPSQTGVHNTESPTMAHRARRALLSLMPFAMIAGLLYAALFIKPKPVGSSVATPVFERGDAFYGIAAPTPATMWAAGTSGKIVHSDDGGRSWTRQATPAPNTLQDIAAWDAKRAVAVGDTGVVLITSDGGRNWEQVQAPHSTIANKLVRVRTLPDGAAWAIGEGGVVLHSMDFGATWAMVMKPEDIAWNDIFFVGDLGWLVGEFGNVRLSTDAGRSWQPVKAPTTGSLMAVSFRSPQDGVAVGLGGTILATHDAGAQWTVVPSGTKEHLFDVTWTGKRWLAVGDNGAAVGAGPDDASWAPLPGQSQSSQWHTRIVVAAGDPLIAGSSLARLSQGSWSALVH